MMTSTPSVSLYDPQDTSSGCLDETAPDDAIEQVLKVSGSGLKDVYRKVQGPPGNAVQVVTAWWMVKTTGLQKKDVANLLNMSNAAVGRAVRRIHCEPIRNPDSDIATWSRALMEQRDRAVL